MKHTVHVGDKVYITTYGDVEEVPVIGLMFGSRFRVHSSVGGDVIVQFNKDMFLNKLKATEKLIDTLTPNVPVSREEKSYPKGSAYIICDFCGSVRTSKEDKCECRFGDR
ncbi:MAG: hypothetical protein ACI35O_09025 [Bacillaceae bacterium]